MHCVIPGILSIGEILPLVSKYWQKNLIFCQKWQKANLGNNKQNFMLLRRKLYDRVLTLNGLNECEFSSRHRKHEN